ncbi:hypothetical protein AYP92_03735 [Lactobacillus crispatus]|uniref:Uncharacterized protein n=1 Tax=Lactobacillus crispatus TaxID=47770 RepID=A0A854PLA9_9LACO|nr:hypothetical protein AYP82_09525 [Lactobacillus crispatus]OXC30080.1 hypothetical protein AYP86_08325 [Lactobacillus crispatus]OXC40394.1 hypothetical protein AYP92_03735 [Lactobacillus crispatus]
MLINSAKEVKIRRERFSSVCNNIKKDQHRCLSVFKNISRFGRISHSCWAFVGRLQGEIIAEINKIIEVSSANILFKLLV